MKTTTVRDFIVKLEPWLPTYGDSYFPKKYTTEMLIKEPWTGKISSNGTCAQWLEILEALDKLRGECEADELEGKT